MTLFKLDSTEPGTTKEETKTNQDKDEEIKSLKEQMALQNKV